MLPIFSQKVKNMNFHKGIVRISATYSSVPIWLSLTAPRCTISQIKWYQPSTCLDRLWNMGFYEKRIPLWLSQRIMVESNTCLNNSLKRFHNQVTSQWAIHAIMYSTSAVLKATDFRFLPEVDLLVKWHLKVLLRSTTFPAQSTSVYPRSVMLPVVYLSPWFIVPRRYLRRFNLVKVMRLNHMLTTKHTFGRVFTKNIKAPTSWRYSEGFENMGQ